MKRLSLLLVLLLFVFALPMDTMAEGSALYIDNTGIYSGMAMSYAQGYAPTVSGGNAQFVLPLKSDNASIDSIKVMPAIGTDADTPFVYGNYEFNVSRGGETADVFVIRLSIPLKQSRVNGTYPIVFKCQYTLDGISAEQDFPVYIMVTDGHDPDWTAPTPSPAPTPTVDQLRIDSNTLYDGMAKTYAQGYVPAIVSGKAYIVLPLIGQTYNGTMTLTANLGTTKDSPFIFGNYSQTVNGGWGAYIFVLQIPLVKDRYNGSYPVVLKAEYLDITGKKASQDFTVYVTISDGKTPPDPNEVPKAEVDKPELFISACTESPVSVGGDEKFTVNATIDNIGAIRARSVRLTYGSETADIVPLETNNSIHLDDIASGKTTTVSFTLRTTKDVLAGNQPFYITLDYSDLYGGAYTATRTFLVSVTQPAEIGYDPISVPKEITAGETITISTNVFNIGKSVLRNVTITVTGAGLFPVSSVFLGDVMPGKTGNGEMKVFIGMLSMTEGYTESYGKTNGKYTISYYDDAGKKHTVDLNFTTEIKEPKIDKATDSSLTEKPEFQWWVTMLVGLAVIAIVVSLVVVNSLVRKMKLR